MSKWKPRNKYEVLPGLFVGSEIGDIDREHKHLMCKMLNGDETVKPHMKELRRQKLELLRSKKLRNFAII